MMRASRSCCRPAPEPPNGAKFMAIADGVWREDADAFARTFYMFDEATGCRPRAIAGARWARARGWNASSGSSEGGKWVEGRKHAPCRGNLAMRSMIPARGAPFQNNQPRPEFQGTIVMAVTRTFSIIKPDATRRNLTGGVTKMLEEAGLRVVASKRIHMTKDQAEGFYGVHRERPFFNDLVDLHDLGPGRGAGARRRRRREAQPRHHGRDQPRQCRRGHDPQGHMPNRSKPIRCMARTATRMPPSRSPSSSSRKKLSGRGH